jgi:hypothetical protein
VHLYLERRGEGEKLLFMHGAGEDLAAWTIVSYRLKILSALIKPSVVRGWCQFRLPVTW